MTRDDLWAVNELERALGPVWDAVTQGPEPDMWVSADGTMHEKCRLYFMVGSDLISEGEVDPGSLPDLGYRRTGMAYVCPDCARVWATAILVNSDGAQCAFEVTAVACEKHHSQWHVPGSLLSGYRNEFYLPLLSARALKREFVVHHKWMRGAGSAAEITHQIGDMGK